MGDTGKNGEGGRVNLYLVTPVDVYMTPTQPTDPSKPPPIVISLAPPTTPTTTTGETNSNGVLDTQFYITVKKIMEIDNSGSI